MPLLRDMLFGETGLGGLLENQTLDAVPSPTRRKPDTCTINGYDLEANEEVDGKYFKGPSIHDLHRIFGIWTHSSPSLSAFLTGQQ